jgi:hypothetical protein
MHIDIGAVRAKMFACSTLGDMLLCCSFVSVRNRGVKALHMNSKLVLYLGSWGSSSSIVSHYRLHNRGSIHGRGMEFFL